MLSIKEAKATLKNIGMSEEETENFEVIIQPFIEYHKYLMDKEDINSEEAENRTQTATKQFLGENMTGGESQVELFGLCGKGYRKFAEDSGYDSSKCDVLETNMVDLVNFIVKITTTLQEKNK
jgi:hypothetical protein